MIDKKALAITIALWLAYFGVTILIYFVGGIE